MERERLEGLGLTEEQIEAVLGEFEAGFSELRTEIGRKQIEIDNKSAEIDKVRIMGEIKDTLKTKYKAKDPDDIIKLLEIGQGEISGDLESEMKRLQKNKAYLFEEDSPQAAGTPIRGETGRFSENETMNSMIRGNI